MGFFSENFAIYGVGLKETLTYRMSMLFSLITGPLYFVTSYIIWNAVFSTSGKTEISGFSLEQMTVYIVINAITVYLIWDNVNENLSNSVQDGNFMVFLLKPISYIRFQFVKKLAHRSLAFFIEFLPVAVIIGLIFGFDVYKNGNLLFYAGAVVIAFIMNYLVHLLLGMLAFWVVETNGFFFIYRAFSIVLNGNLVPLSFFPPIVQKVFFVLPFQFIGYVPARIFIGDYALGGVVFSPLEVLGYGVLQIVVLSVLAIVLWKFATRRFYGVGA